MASTRNKNTPGDYKLEKKSNNQFIDYNTYTNYGIPMPINFASDGLLMGRMASEQLSNNACDIESQLFGIGSSNLENPLPEVVPKIKQLNSLSIIDRMPLLLPDTMAQIVEQRPFRGDN
jgi:hypothetical protein